MRTRQALRTTAVAVVIATLAGTAHLALQKHVTLVVGGEPRAVNTSSSNVGGLLAAEGITLSAGYRVKPSPVTPLANGMTVVVSPAPLAPHAALATATVNDVGVWVMDGVGSGPDARRAAVLAETSVSAEGTGSSVVRVRAVVAGKVHDVFTNATTAGALLSAMGIHPGAGDRVRPSLQTPLHDGSTVRFDPLMMTIVAAARVPGAVPSPGGTHNGTQTGLATWYDPPWSGFTAASPSLPFGTHVTVTDLSTGRSIVVVIDDRGPFGSSDRIIDLSPEAFSALAPLGRGVVDVQISW